MRSPLLLLLASLLALPAAAGNWNPQGAAAYLDGRAEWWIGWKQAARDQDTFCISCHTALPYALARPSLRTALGEHGPSKNETRMLDNVRKRVRLWAEMSPLYTDEKSGPSKSVESRGTEAVLNALILVSEDSAGGKLSESSRQALDNMWALQYKDGAAKGAWPWLNFHNQPWEADDSQFWGATLAAVAVGAAPEDYRSLPEVRERLQALAGYFDRKAPEESLLNRTGLLWAAARLPQLLPPERRQATLSELFSKQREDGGWSAASLTPATWKRRDGTANDSTSDGYATGLVSFVLQKAGASRDDRRIERALTWLELNQDKRSGVWRSTSLNKQRDPESDAGRFMTDAGTAYAVLALSSGR